MDVRWNGFQCVPTLKIHYLLLACPDLALTAGLLAYYSFVQTRC